MTERPILMNQFSVNATLDYMKTQTRRMRGLKGINIYPGNWTFQRWEETFKSKLDKDIYEAEALFKYTNDGSYVKIKCPYGNIGDRLWVRETTSTLHYRPIYRADKIIEDQPINKIVKDYGIRWTPSIFMPKERSRITLDIMDIRIEGIRNISDLDIIQEGIPNRSSYLKRLEFISLWNSINEKSGYGWVTDPWVWVIVYKIFSLYGKKIDHDKSKSMCPKLSEASPGSARSF